MPWKPLKDDGRVNEFPCHEIEQPAGSPDVPPADPGQVDEMRRKAFEFLKTNLGHCHSTTR